MKTELKLTLAALLIPLATACVAQTTTGEDVNASEQDLTTDTTSATTAQAQPQQGAKSIVVEQRERAASQFTRTTVVGGPARDMASDEQDPTTPKKIDGVDPVPVPWDPTRITKR